MDFSKLLRVAFEALFPRRRQLSGIQYWKERVKKYGKRSVLNLGFSEHEYDVATEKQKSEIYQFFKRSLRGDEKEVLDFGCGTGRFTSDLAKMTGGRAIGVDPLAELLQHAPQGDNVEYKLMKEGEIPLPDNSVGVVWICLVLGGIEDRLLSMTISDINRVLKKGGLLFLVENTTEKTDASYWKFRQYEDYRELLPFAPLERIHDYYELDERISIMAGRK